jgi:hypothetical protein
MAKSFIPKSLSKQVQFNPSTIKYDLHLWRNHGWEFEGSFDKAKDAYQYGNNVVKQKMETP